MNNEQINLDWLPHKSGIYCIENLATRKIYIGSSKNIYKRILYGHIYHLANDIHYNNHLQNSFNKHNGENFIYYTLELCEVDQLTIREQAYFDVFLHAQEYINSGGRDERFHQFGYNLQPIAGRSEGFKHSEETIKQLIQDGLDRWQDEQYRFNQALVRTQQWHEKRMQRSIEAKQNDPTYKDRLREAFVNSKTHNHHTKKAVLVYNRHTGEFVDQFESIRDCSEQMSIGYEMAKIVVSGRRRYTKDFTIKYKQSETFPLRIEPVQRYTSLEKRREGMQRAFDKNSKAILCYDLNGKFISEYKSAVDAGNQLNLDPAGIRTVLYGKCIQCKGYTFKYKDPNYKPKQYKPRERKVA